MRVRPRFELEDAAIQRLEPAALVPVAAEPRMGWSSFGLAGAGAGVLLLGLAALETANFVVDQFARAPVLGWLTLAVAVAGFGLILAAGLRELRGLLALRGVDRIRAGLADPARCVAAARTWLAHHPEFAGLAPAVAAAPAPDAVVALLRAGPVATLRQRADQLGTAAGVQVFAATAAIPSPALDGLLVAWRGIRLVRAVAALHGMRPGLFATLALLRRSMISAASVAATDLAVDALARAAISNRLVAHVAGDVAGAGVAARRMVVLARATAAACSPVPP